MLVAAGLTVALVVPVDRPDRAAGRRDRSGRARRPRSRFAVARRGRRDAPTPCAFVGAQRLHVAGARLGLGYTLIWEGVLAGLLEGTRFLSIRQATLGIARGLAGEAAEAGSLDLGLSVVIVAVAVVAAFVLGSVRLARFEIRGAD